MRITNVVFIILFTTFFFNCKKVETKKKIDQVTLDSLYTLNDNYPVNDVRRYGVIPSNEVGLHPKLKKNKLDVILDLAESGYELVFPEGYYNHSLKINGRENVKLKFNNSAFSGVVEVRNSNNINLLGDLISYVKFYTKESSNVNLDNLYLKSNTALSGNKKRNLGCSIHSGSEKVNIKKIVIEELASGKELGNVKAAFICHGHNNEPQNINVDTLIVKSSDRHGVYLTGSKLSFNYISIDKFGLGERKDTNPMEGGIQGEQFLFSGLWIKNSFDSSIGKVVINNKNSEGVYSINFDVGEFFRPTKIDSIFLIDNDTDIKERILKRSGVKYKSLIRQND